ncbi:hypothetical protein LZ32DRAFT_510003, partial [Colletotrichum eremochloae]
MSVGKVTASAVAASLEATMALAALNFDFSLVRVEAPREYQPIRDALSSRRKEEAEEGISHITARKLGALFKDAVPDTPNLFRAYGLRASEILQSPAHNPKSTRGDGIFADQIGADGTTIWAAATSGREAIAMHLLACMISRLWSGPEATSLWDQLVQRRQEIVAMSEATDPGVVAPLSVSKISLTRDQLAAWDSSARAWLQTADQAKERSQKQLLLIVNNLGINLESKVNVYDNVMQIWVSAMNMMDRLIAGSPQSVSDGGPLLGLVSWHLYPDMMVFVKGSKHVRQNDDLIATGGIITLGLQSASAGKPGIFWSLPLSFHRFYGYPVMACGSYSAESSRVSINDLHLVALGSLLGSW